MKINITKLLENFIDFKNIANFNILICYKQLFTKEGIIKNIGSIIIIIIILFHIISIYIFYVHQSFIFKIQIRGILSNKNQLTFIRKKEESEMKEKTKDILIKVNEKQEDNKIKEATKENKDGKNINNFKERKKLVNDNISSNNINSRNKKNTTKTENQTSIDMLNSKLNKNDIIEKEGKFQQDYYDYELNSFSYDLALLYDKRTY